MGGADGFFNFFKEVLDRLQMYGNGCSMTIVLDHGSTATSLTGNLTITLAMIISDFYLLVWNNVLMVNDITI